MEMREEIRKSIFDNGDRFEPSTDPARTKEHNNPVTKKQMAESWIRVKEVFAGALRQAPAERESYLDHVCSDDRYLRDEVESLLDSFESADTFLESPASVNGESLRTFGECFAPGQKVGQYEIIRKLGSGGMGEVYLARDAKLHRPVAIKALYRDVSGGDESKKQLLREARAAATLDHPNICSIHEISEIEGRSFIVMQYVEGETLGEILENGPLELADAIEIGMQIADALEEAHHHKIIHRDIKPGNIIVTEKGLVKVLDFGLAKSLETGSLADSVKHPDTNGMIMGTIPYMSPEQLRGKSLDARTDIFSLGAVLYEMFTGSRVFRKDNQAESVSAILNDQPDLGPVPPSVRFLIQKALMKDKRRRHQSAVELGNDLRNLRDSIKSGSLGRKSLWSWFSGRRPNTSSYRSFFSRGTAQNIPHQQRLYAWEGSQSHEHTVEDRTQNHDIRYGDFRTFTLYFLTPLAMLAMGFLTWYLWPGPQPPEPLRTVKVVTWNTGASSIYKDYSLSHDGKMIAYSSNQSGVPESIYIKQTGDGKDVPVVNDQWRNYSPVWSPDDRRIAFTSFRDGAFGIYTVPSFGGVATFVKTIGANLVSLRQWSKDGTSILYEYQGNLFRVNVSTGEASQMTDFPPSTSVMRNFRLSADETKIAYSDALNGQTDIWLIENGQRRQLTNTKDEETRLAWHPDGKRILFTASRDGHYQIDVANVDGKTVEQVTRGDGEYELIDVSADGAKIFYRSWEDKSDVWSVKLENGEETDVASEPESEFWPAVSPDGQWIAYQTNSNPAPFRVLQKSSITVKSNKDGSKRLSIVGTHPQWLPDNRRLSFLRWNDETQKNELWVVDTNTGDEKLVANDPIPFPAGAPFPFNRAQVRDFSWSPDGSNVVYSVQTSGVKDLRMRNTHEGEVVALTNNQDPARSFLSPVWSPSGRRLAYVSQQKVVAKDQKPEWNVWLYENGRVKTIFTTSSSLRLLGWISEDKLLFEKCDGPMSSRLSDITLLKLSVSGEATTLFDVHDVYALSMAAAPNGKTVAYSARQNDKDNIWIGDITSGSQRKITANANSKLFFGGLSWTSDSKTVYFDKQEEINTISMIDNFK